MNWRDKAQRTIAQVRRDNPTATPEQMDKLLFDAYPFGQRKYHPYKIWLEEVKKAKKLPTPVAIKNFWIK
jgi:hypothetical protein